jgi:hypothetical protein
MACPGDCRSARAGAPCPGGSPSEPDEGARAGWWLPFLLPAVGHPAANATTHTITFTAITEKQATIGSSTFVESEVDRNKAGNIIGVDVINGTFNSTMSSMTGRVALSTKGGMLYGKLAFPTPASTRGKVTGGTGKFKGSTGTISGKNLNADGTRVRVTVTYQN